MTRTLNSFDYFINQLERMENQSQNQAGFQQLIHQGYIQVDQMIEQLQMKSIHSSNSQHSSPENISKEAQQANGTNNTSQKDRETKVNNIFKEEEKNMIDEVNVIKEENRSNVPIIYDYHYSKDVNLLQDLQSSKQLECVQSTKIYPSQKQQELKIISQQKEENRNTYANLQKNEVKKVPQAQEGINNCSNSKKENIVLMACQRGNKITQKYQKKADSPKTKPKQEKIEEELKYNHEFEQYFYKCKLEFFGKCCKGGNPIQMICVEKVCNAQAEHCLNQKCKNCIQNHSNCYLKFTYDMFVKSLQKNVIRQKNTMQIVYEAYSNILTEIHKNRQKTMKFLCVQGVNQSLMGKLQQSYQLCNYISFKGKQVLNVLEQLNHQSENNIQREIRVREKMKQDEKEIIAKLNKEMHLLFEPYSVCSLNILNSHLVSNKNDVKFILQQLNYPRDMKLLYRASQHEFSISKFHQICDNQENTFTIIKTQFGKFIGGFTPLKWNTKYGRDRTNKTFLLAINLKEKLEHINHGQSAIYYDERLGPSFGGLFETKDLQIFEENGILCCKTNFPNTFNWKKFFTSGQQSWKFLTGVQLGRKCRVMDYQVFKVFFRSQKKQ